MPPKTISLTQSTLVFRPILRLLHPTRPRRNQSHRILDSRKRSRRPERTLRHARDGPHCPLPSFRFPLDRVPNQEPRRWAIARETQCERTDEPFLVPTSRAKFVGLCSGVRAVDTLCVRQDARERMDEAGRWGREARFPRFPRWEA
jgi:hypothetical protein